MKINHKTTIDIQPKGISYEFTLRYREEENGMYSWFIPGFNIFYSTKTRDLGEKRGVAMTRSFFKYWIEKEGFNNFILQLNNLGFKPKGEPQHKSGNVVIHELLRKQRNTAVFKSSDWRIPGSFADSSKIEKKEVFNMASVA